MKVRKPDGKIRKEFGSGSVHESELRDRTTHTETQSTSTIHDLQETIAEMLEPGEGIDITWVDGTGTISATGGQVLQLGDIVISQTAVISISAGIRSVTVSGVTGLLTTDRVLLAPAEALPSGYAIHNAFPTSAGVLQVTLSAPLLGIGASYSIDCAVFVIRPS